MPEMKTIIEPAQDDEPPNPALQRNGATAEVLLVNRQRTVRTDCSKLSEFLCDVQRQVARSPFSVRLVSDRSIRRFNKQFRGQDKATDVLSFPAGEGQGEEHYLGDILISVETARKNATRFGVKLDQELKLLALHGILHLMGYDHESDRGQMARLESKWRLRLGLPVSLIERSKAAIPTVATGRKR